MNFWTNEYAAGYLPAIISEADPLPVAEQMAEKYIGGWNPFAGFTLHNAEVTHKAFLTYPGDPDLQEVSRTTIRDELVILFQYSWLAVVQKDGSYVISRAD